MASSREEFQAQLDLRRAVADIITAISQQQSIPEYHNYLIQLQRHVYSRLLTLTTYLAAIAEVIEFITTQQIERGYDLRCLPEFKHLPQSPTEIYYRDAFEEIECEADEFSREYHAWYPVYDAYHSAKEFLPVLLVEPHPALIRHHKQLLHHLHQFLPNNYNRRKDMDAWTAKFDALINENIVVDDTDTIEAYDELRSDLQNKVGAWLSSGIDFSHWEDRFGARWNSNDGDSDDEQLDEPSPSNFAKVAYGLGTMALVMNHFSTVNAKDNKPSSGTQNVIFDFTTFAKFSNELGTKMGDWVKLDTKDVTLNIKSLADELVSRREPLPPIEHVSIDSTDIVNNRQQQISEIQKQLNPLISLPKSHEKLDNYIKRLKQKFPENKIEPYNWDSFDVLNYMNYRSKIESNYNRLISAVKKIKSVLTSRKSVAHLAVDNINDELLVAAHRHEIRSLRLKLSQAEKMLDEFKLTMGDVVLGLPDLSTLEKYGVHTQPIGVGFTEGELKKVLDKSVKMIGFTLLRHLASRGAREASIKLGDCYAEGKYVTRDIRAAKLFYRQGLRQKRDYLSDTFIYDRLMGIDASTVIRKCKRVVQEYRAFIFNPITAKKYAHLDGAQKQLHGIQRVPHETFAPDSYNLADLAHFNLDAIINPRPAPPELIARLKMDIAQLSVQKKEIFTDYLSAILDGEYSAAPIIANYYAKYDEWLSLRWFTLAADHGHIHAMYVAGKAYTFGYKSAKGRLENDPVKGKPYLTKAAAYGNADASRLLAQGTIEHEISAYYSYQARLQDPLSPLNDEADKEKENTLATAVRSRGLSPVNHAFEPENLEWYPVPRDDRDPNINHLWKIYQSHQDDHALFTKHHTDFKDHRQSCFQSIAEYYKNVKFSEAEPHSSEALSLVWSLLGFRSGDIEAATIFGDYAIRSDSSLDVIQEPLSSIVKNTYAAVTLHMEGYSGLDKQDGTLSEYITPLGHEALLFASYYHHPRAPLLLANLRMMGEGQYAVSALARSRAYFAQATLVKHPSWVTFFNYASVTTTYYKSLADAMMVDKGHTPESWLQKYFDLISMRQDLSLAINLAHQKLMHHVQGNQLIDAKWLKARVEQIDSLSKYLETTNNLPTIEWFTSLGIQIPLEANPHYVADETVRVREEWEWHDIIPSLVKDKFVNEDQPRAQTLLAFYGESHPILRKLNFASLKNPDDMLQLRQYCLEKQRNDLAERWLDHAAAMGDRIANRILALQAGNSTTLLRLIAAHGDPVASEWLANQPGINSVQQQLLLTQAKLWLAHATRRPLYPEGHLTKHPSALSWYYLLITLPVAGLGWGVNKLVAWNHHRHTTQLNEQKLRVNSIQRQLRFLRKVSFIDFSYEESSQRFAATLKKMPADVTLKIQHAVNTNMTELELSSAEKMILAAIEKLMSMKLLPARNNADKSVKSLLSLLDIKQNKGHLSCSAQYSKNKVRLTYHEQINLISSYIELAGFDSLVLTDKLDDTTLISLSIQDNYLNSDLKEYICVSMLDKAVRLHFDHQLQLREAELLKEQAARDHLQLLSDAIKLIQRLTKESTTAPHLKKSTHLFICDLRQEVNSKISEVSEDRSYTHPGRVIRAGKEILNICHKLIGSDPVNTTLGLFSSLSLVQGCITGLGSADNRYENETRIINFATDFHRLFNLISENSELQFGFSQYYKDFCHHKEEVIRKSSLSSVEVISSPRHSSEDEILSMPANQNDGNSVEEVESPVVSAQRERKSVLAIKPISLFTSETNKMYKGFIVSLLKERYASILILFNDPSLSLPTFTLLRQRALHFRLLRLHLVIELLNQKEFIHLPINSVLRNEMMGAFSRNWGHALMHNNSFVQLPDLQSCVETCYVMQKEEAPLRAVRYVARLINSETPALVSHTKLCQTIWKDVENIVIPLTCEELIADLKRLFSELVRLRQESKSQLDSAAKLDVYHDACRMTLMCIGEDCKRLHEMCHHLRDQLYEKQKDLAPLYRFLCKCLHVRNQDRHVDICFERVRNSDPLTELSTDLENFSAAEIMRLVGTGIRLTESSPEMFDQLQVLLYEIMLMPEDGVIVRQIP